ncbi:hypothetical protein KR038_000084, partial [Drosophila bunnanda]
QTERGAAERIRRELCIFREEPPEGCRIEVDENDIYHWKAAIDGPANTPYQGGVFRLDLRFTEEYPFKPPDVKFSTRLFHCNISPEGEICLDILGPEWSPALTAARILLSIRSLLVDPNTEDRLVPEHAKMYVENRPAYEANARVWTRRYAKPDS